MDSELISVYTEEEVTEGMDFSREKRATFCSMKCPNIRHGGITTAACGVARELGGAAVLSWEPPREGDWQRPWAEGQGADAGAHCRA